MEKLFYQYWGKAKPSDDLGSQWHPLVYHSLDVAAVAACWWDVNSTIQSRFLTAFNCTPSQHKQLHAWILFFVSLHDLGKFDVRFQLKAPEALAMAWRVLGDEDHRISKKEIKEFDHGLAGIVWAKQEYKEWIDSNDIDRELWQWWGPWLTATTGHHGDFYLTLDNGLKNLDADEDIIKRDREARREFIIALANLFLDPAGLKLSDRPPFCSDEARPLLAGFCSVCDWIGSNPDIFAYQTPLPEMKEYFNGRIKQIQKEDLFSRFGLVSKRAKYSGVKALLKSEESPRGVQVEVDRLPVTAGLTLVEAPTGSGKTEAALAYAWRLLDQEVADSIVFALPTQATANAMLSRIETFAGSVFGNANVVLAHGKSQLNTEFNRLVTIGQQRTVQGKIDAAVQCASWLSSSRKRVFLGQVGVCTVDQVLLSVLPVRHQFVRGFGLNKSVLIVDEVHAYDAYMHGLLGEVLRRQKAVGGSAILLSATLPAGVREKLLEAWQCSGTAGEAPYPALWHTTQRSVTPLTIPEEYRPERREVEVECVKLSEAFPDDALLESMISAAESGAQVAVIMNVVDDAQKLARLLRSKTQITIDLFHARYRFLDRQSKEKAVLDAYGRHASREKGRILVATQVVEQSLDLDFDWMITQICPVDLLFQRLGRLHRHLRNRPVGFESPRCTVLSTKNQNYGVHQHIYENTRVLWRTENLLMKNAKIIFPEAYRTWIDAVYKDESLPNEPETIQGEYLAWKKMQEQREKDALKLTTLTVKNFRDNDEATTGLTRDGEMSLSILLLQSDGRLLNGQKLEALNEHDLEEALNLNAVPVPSTWEKHLQNCSLETEGNLGGYFQLKMNADGVGGWLAENGRFYYSEEFGLERKKNESA